MENNLKKCDHCKRDAVVIIDNYKLECAECHLEKLKSKDKSQDTWADAVNTGRGLRPPF